MLHIAKITSTTVPTLGFARSTQDVEGFAPHSLLVLTIVAKIDVTKNWLLVLRLPVLVLILWFLCITKTTTTDCLRYLQTMHTCLVTSQTIFRQLFGILIFAISWFRRFFLYDKHSDSFFLFLLSNASHFYLLLIVPISLLRSTDFVHTSSSLVLCDVYLCSTVSVSLLSNCIVAFFPSHYTF